MCCDDSDCQCAASDLCPGSFQCRDSVGNNFYVLSAKLEVSHLSKLLLVDSCPSPLMAGLGLNWGSTEPGRKRGFKQHLRICQV